MLNLAVLLVSVLALVALDRAMPRGLTRWRTSAERGAVGWEVLLPTVLAQQANDFALNGAVNGGNGGGNGAVNGGPVVSQAFGADKFIRLGARALGAYKAWQGAPVHPGFDVSETGQLDDQELAKVIAQYGAIPADSDLGQLAVAAGARTRRQRVRFSDGTAATIDVVGLGGRGAPARRGRVQLTSYRLGTASWVLRKLHAQQRLGRRLASLAKRLYPSSRKK